MPESTSIRRIIIMVRITIQSVVNSYVFSFGFLNCNDPPFWRCTFVNVISSLQDA